MLDQIESMFDHYEEKLVFMTHKKRAYDDYLAEFRKEHGHFFQEMTELMDAAEDKDEEAEAIARVVVEAVREKYQKWGRVSARRRADLDFYLIYYVFPSLLLTGHPDAVTLADHLRDTWNEQMKEHITYTGYDEIRSSFHDKILGLIPIKDE